MKNDKEILESVIDKIKKSKPMSKEFSNIVDKYFWELI